MSPTTPATSFPGSHLRITLAALAIVTVAIIGAPETHWEMDELLFHMGIESFDPLAHRPHPPGYPLLVGLGKLLTLVTGDPFTALVALAIISVVTGFVAFAIAIRNIMESESAGLMAAALFFLSPAMIIHGPAPMSDPPALMFLALALWAATRVDRGSQYAALFGIFAAASIGCRPQYAIPILPALGWMLVITRGSRPRLAMITAFTLSCLSWFVPLVSAVGGLAAFIDWQTAQAAWVAEVDAGVARHALGTGGVLKRFLAHPWGPKWMSFPVLVIAAAGFARALRLRMTAFVPLIIVATAHALFTILTCDPADGVRYILPTHLATAAFAALAIVWITRRLPATPAIQLALISLFVASSYAYVWPLLRIRSTAPAPPIAAIDSAAELAPDTLIVYDDDVRPHVDALLTTHHARRAVDAESQLFDEPREAAILFGEGRSLAPDAIVFRWPDSDAYGKITRNHYRTVSLDPLLPRERFRVVRGVGPWRSVDGGARWRWIEEEAEIEIPPCCGRLELVLGFPEEAPWNEVSVEISADGRPVREVRLERGSVRRVRLRIPDGAAAIELRASNGFVPADRRASQAPVRLSAKLHDLRREHDASGAAHYNRTR